MARRRRVTRTKGPRRKTYWTTFSDTTDGGSSGSSVFATARDPVETYNELANVTPSSTPSIPEGDTLIRTIIMVQPTVVDDAGLQSLIFNLTFGESSASSLASLSSDDIMYTFPYCVYLAAGAAGGLHVMHEVKAMRKMESPQDLRLNYIRIAGFNSFRFTLRCLFKAG